MVRRLVEEEEIGRQQPKDCQFEATPFATREHGHLLINFVSAEEESGEVATSDGCLNGNGSPKRLNDSCSV
jgi:hypothetical protein